MTQIIKNYTNMKVCKNRWRYVCPSYTQMNHKLSAIRKKLVRKLAAGRCNYRVSQVNIFVIVIRPMMIISTILSNGCPLTKASANVFHTDLPASKEFPQSTPVRLPTLRVTVVTPYYVAFTRKP